MQALSYNNQNHGHITRQEQLTPVEGLGQKYNLENNIF